MDTVPEALAGDPNSFGAGDPGLDLPAPPASAGPPQGALTSAASSVASVLAPRRLGPSFPPPSPGGGIPGHHTAATRASPSLPAGAQQCPPPSL